MRRALPLLLLSLPMLMTGCRNACQQLCGDIVDYAEECNLSVPDDAKSTCIADHKRGETTRDERGICAENRSSLKDEWTCDDVEQYIGATQGDAAE